MTTAATKEPSDFMTALKKLKPVWQDHSHPTSSHDWELVEKQYWDLIALGKEIGLSSHFINYKLNEITTNCKECDTEISIDAKHDERLCSVCFEKKQKQEWLEECEEIKRREDPIERYCHKIRGTIPYYERPFEALKQEAPKIEDQFPETYRRIMSGDTKDAREEAQRQEWMRRREERQYDDIKYKPEGMSKSKWIKEGVKRRKLWKEEHKEAELDQRLRYHNSPIAMFEDRIGKVRCKCKAEDMRQGIFCKTCRLITKVNQYTLDLFKDASEGRSTLV